MHPSRRPGGRTQCGRRSRPPRGFNDEHSLGLLPEAVLSEFTTECRLRHDAKRKVRTAVLDVRVRVVEGVQVRLADVAQSHGLTRQHGPSLGPWQAHRPRSRSRRLRPACRHAEVCLVNASARASAERPILSGSASHQVGTQVTVHACSTSLARSGSCSRPSARRWSAITPASQRSADGKGSRGRPGFRRRLLQGRDGSTVGVGPAPPLGASGEATGIGHPPDACVRRYVGTASARMTPSPSSRTPLANSAWGCRRVATRAVCFSRDWCDRCWRPMSGSRGRRRASLMSSSGG